MWTAAFWKDAGERAVKTFAQTSLALLTVGQAFADVDWATVGSIGGVAAVISVLSSVASSSNGNASLVNQPAKEIPDGDGRYRAE